MGVLSRVRSDDDETDCGCEPSFDGDRLMVDADNCPGEGRLATEPACRETVVDALRERDADAICTRAVGTERAYEGTAAAALVAAGRFADAAAFHDEGIADRAHRDPLGAARAATGRAGPVARLAAETGLAEVAARADGYDDLLAPAVGPTIGRSRVRLKPPATARFASRRELETGAVVRIYDEPDHERRTYHLEPVEYGFGGAATERLVAAYDRLASGAVSGGERAPGRAVRRVVDNDDEFDATVGVLERVLKKHTTGYGVIADLFADERVSDVFVTAPAADNRIRVRVDGETLTTNVRLTEGGIEALASRFRRESGRAFSRASPALDATATVAGRRVRVAGVTEPVSEGVAFAFRAHEREAWTLPALVANGTLPVEAAALLSLAVERDAATLLAGTRGAGKTTLLGALLWELPAETRTVVIEDSPELPVGQLQDAGRDVQSLRTGDGDGGELTPAEALRTALRLGEGALVLGEVRGEEAGVLYEAMRVGASGSAVLGTIHGDGGAAVRERVVTDLGVPESSFGATDLLVTLEPYESPSGRARRVKRIEEVVTADAVGFEPLFELDDGDLTSTGRIERGNSRLLDGLARSGESYAAVRDRLHDRTDWLADLADGDRTDPEKVRRAHARRRAERTV
ncbi:type II secretion protein [Halorientalis sp. IM1011]|uniref:ATPase, T2SS/T4P/T4SS family n=1 Tax=Halorientalis sp. IM1011 TaxID=1932360 RepID=UPI00097CCBE5|nr:ATPase, T2SS/T4P/T4SS family [Halorientalis sp. IM1011]AQL41985.1 type II secretion protein [Halorientalis sp. IM1011]